MTILPLRRGGELREVAMAAGLKVLDSGIWSVFRCLLRPHWNVVDGWMYGGAAFASLFSVRGIPVTWNLHHVPLDLTMESRATRTLLKILPKVPAPKCIVVNSVEAICVHRALGCVAPYRFIVNGIDTSRFRRDTAAAARFREAQDISAESFLIVQVARNHPHKGQRVLLRAVKILVERGIDITVGFVGLGTQKLAVDATEFGINLIHCRFVGKLDDVVGVLSAADVVVNASLTESSPTVVAEALSCGAICVATNVGETARLIRDAGTIVPPDDPTALAAAIAEVVNADEKARERLMRAARARAATDLSLDTTVAQYTASALNAASYGLQNPTSERATRD